MTPPLTVDQLALLKLAKRELIPPPEDRAMLGTYGNVQLLLLLRLIEASGVGYRITAQGLELLRGLEAAPPALSSS